MELRRRIDCEYCDINQPVNWLAGVKVFGDYAGQLSEIEAVMRERSEQLLEFEGYLRTISGSFERFLSRSKRETMEYIVHHSERFRAFLKSEQPDLVAAYDRTRCDIDAALLAYATDGQLAEDGASPAMIAACHAYAGHIAGGLQGLFHKANATRLRSAKAAFHANVKNVRSIYERRGRYAKLDDGDRQAMVVQILGEAMSAHEEHTQQLMEVRLHHALCRINTLIVADLVSSLRDYDWKPARTSLAKGCRKILDTVKPR